MSRDMEEIPENCVLYSDAGLIIDCYIKHDEQNKRMLVVLRKMKLAHEDSAEAKVTVITLSSDGSLANFLKFIQDHART